MFNEGAFLRAMSVTVAAAAYLPAAGAFVLMPLASAGFARTGSSGGAQLDYDVAAGAVKLVATRPYRCAAGGAGAGAGGGGRGGRRAAAAARGGCWQQPAL